MLSQGNLNFEFFFNVMLLNPTFDLVLEKSSAYVAVCQTWNLGPSF